jgi:two-component system, chemotaxis family, chemotaxis protein CheY
MSDASRTRRVLVVDDAALVRRYVRQALEPAGFEVDEAINGIDAMEKVLATPFDLLVVDINMPKMDGYTFLHAVRAGAPDISSIPALMTSTEAAQHDAAAAQAAGANFYLVKPTGQADLVFYANAMTGRSP